MHLVYPPGIVYPSGTDAFGIYFSAHVGYPYGMSTGEINLIDQYPRQMSKCQIDTRIPDRHLRWTYRRFHKIPPPA